MDCVGDWAAGGEEGLLILSVTFRYWFGLLYNHSPQLCPAQAHNAPSFSSPLRRISDITLRQWLRSVRDQLALPARVNG